MVVYAVADIKNELSKLTPLGRISNGTWTKWRNLAGIPRHARNCTYDQWVNLCGIVAMKLDGRRRITPVSLKIFLKRNGSDPMLFIPGYLPSAQTRLVPDRVMGSEIAAVIQEHTGYKPSEWTVRRWCKRLEFKYSRSKGYSGSQIQSLISLYIQIRSSEIQRMKQINRGKLRNQRRAA